jgi:hypothetical protein
MSVQWTRRIKGVKGSRWSCYEQYVKGRVEISWQEFKEQVVQHNSELKKDNWIFRPEKQYVLPMVTETVVGQGIPFDLRFFV